MKFGIYYAYWAKKWGVDYVPYVQKVSDLGFDILEISCAGLKDLPPGEIEALRDAAVRCGVQLTGGYGPKAEENIASADPAVAENGLAFWRDTFPVLQKLGITVVGGGLYGYWPVDYSKEPDKAGDWERSVSNMRRLGKMAEDYGITLGMESLNRHEGYLINTAAECVKYVQEVGLPNVRVMLDTYHMSMEEDDLVEAIRTAGPLLGHVHVGENNRRVPGQGNMIPWEALGAALREVGYDGAVVMEPFVIHGGQVGRDIRVWRDLLPDTSEKKLDEDAAASVQFLRKAFTENR